MTTMRCVNCETGVEPVENTFPDPKNPKVSIQVDTCPYCGGTL